MSVAIVLSSYVAASRVGGMVQALALAELKIDPIIVPTVLFGRHPGWGPPGGGAVSTEVFDGMLEAIETNGYFASADVVITGYFATAAQVRSAARTIDIVRATRPVGPSTKLRIIVDPIMGDAGEFYVTAEVAGAIVSELVPRADLIAPNAWELERLSGMSVTDPNSAWRAARRLGKPVLVSSVPCGSEIGVVYADATGAWLAAHPRQAKAPKGVGDLLTALFAAALIEQQPIAQALARSVGGVAETILAAKLTNADELPVVAMGPRIGRTTPSVRIERLRA
jgi:pyridoxine kinase